ncbi:MAG: Yip1 family protein [Burkholderiales bacterium]
MSGVVHRVVSLFVHPDEAWEEIAREPASIDALTARYIVPFALLAPIATVVGMRVFDATWDPARGYRVPPEAIYAAGATTLFATIVSIFLLAAIFWLIAPMYGVGRDYPSALKVATYGAVPVLLAGATLFIPVMVMVSVVALCHTLYLYWLGVGRVLNVRPDEQTEFVGIALTLLGGVSTLAGAAVSSIGLG